MNIVITGSSGLVGSSCVRQALKLDNTHIYSVSRQSIHNIEAGKITHFNSISELPTSVEFDLVIHAAAATPNNTEFSQIARSNWFIDSALEKFLKVTPVKHVCYLSTMAIYGEISDSIVTEYTAPNNPNEYGLSKYQGEELISRTIQNTSTKLTVLRLPGVVGPRMSNIFFKKCHEWLLKNDAITIQSKKAQFNNAVYVSDIFETAMNIYRDDCSACLVLNMHSADQMTLVEFLNLYAKALNTHPHIKLSNKAGKPFVIANENNDHLIITRPLKSIIKSYLKQ